MDAMLVIRSAVVSCYFVIMTGRLQVNTMPTVETTNVVYDLVPAADIENNTIVGCRVVAGIALHNIMVGVVFKKYAMIAITYADVVDDSVVTCCIEIYAN